MAFWELFIVALMPVLTTLLITALGLLLAIDCVDLLGPNVRHHLNNLVFYVFGPALVGGYLAKTITLQSLATLWFMPVNIFFTFVIGSALALILNKIARTPRHLQGLVIGCCSAGNLGNLLLIILPELCTGSNSPFGDSTTCTANAETYTSLSMSVGSVYIWAYVYPIMCAYANKNLEGIETNDPTVSTKSSGGTSESYTEALLPLLDEAEMSSSGSWGEKKVQILGKISQWFNKFTRKINLKMVFAPATMAAIVGFVIGTVSPIRKAMIGDNAPLRVLESSAMLLGEATVPSMTLIVGANLLRGLRRSEVGPSLIIGIIAVRNIFLPLIGIGIVKAAQHFGMVGSDLLYQFVLMLQYALPPGMTVGMITQLFDAGQSECSVIMLWAYAVASFSLTLWSTLLMWLLA